MIPGACCGHPPAMADTAVYEWPAGTVVTWYLDGADLPAGFSRPVASSVIMLAAAAWSRACGAEIEQVYDPAAARIVVSFVRLDSSLVTLGLTDLPVPGTGQVRLRLNIAVRWDLHELTLVAMHEFGHALGLVHSDATAPVVMNPIYQPQLDGLQDWDTAQARLRYGPPPAPPAAPTSTTPPPPAISPLRITVSEPGSVEVEIDFAAAGDYEIRIAPVQPSA